MFSIEKLCFEVFVICKHVLHAFFMEVSASLSFVIDEVLWVNKNIFRCKFFKFQESFVIDKVLWVNKNIFRYKCFTVPFEPQPACK